jgi:two-component system chemotaxis response regulator CheY
MSKKGILIVDDAKFSRIQIKRVIDEIDNVEVIGEAENGNEAVLLYEKLKPDLITMDLVMPEKGGVQAIEEIIRMDKSAIIIVISAIGQDDLMLEATEKGAKEYIVKPFKPNELRKVLENHLMA